MKTRAPPSVELVECPDEAQEYSGLMEPFFLTTRQLGDNNLKLIWWYIAAVDDCEMGQRGFQLPGDEKFEAHFFDYDTAIETLTYLLDKAIVQKAVELVKASYH